MLRRKAVQAPLKTAEKLYEAAILLGDLLWAVEMQATTYVHYEKSDVKWEDLAKRIRKFLA